MLSGRRGEQPHTHRRCPIKPTLRAASPLLASISHIAHSCLVVVKRGSMQSRPVDNSEYTTIGKMLGNWYVVSPVQIMRSARPRRKRKNMWPRKYRLFPLPHSRAPSPLYSPIVRPRCDLLSVRVGVCTSVHLSSVLPFMKTVGRLSFNPTPRNTTEHLVLPTMRLSLLPSSGLSNGSSLRPYLARRAPGDITSTQTQTTLKSVFSSPERLLTVIGSLFNRRASFLIKSGPAPP